MEERSTRPCVVIVGAGFGGLYAAKILRHEPVDVLLLDRNNYHLFQPLLYQVATSALSAPDIARPIRTILRGSANTTVLLGDVRAIDSEGRRVLLADDAYSYDYLILAAGTTNSYFGREGWAPHAPSLKTLADAFEIRRRMLLAFESAERETDPELRRPWQTFVIVGAGPTGVELAGALREIATKTMVRDYRHSDPERTRVVLVEAADRVLPQFPEELSRKARRMLERVGVEVRTGSLVTRVEADGIELGDERIRAKTCIWAAGVKAAPLTKSLGVECTPDGRVLVESDLSVPGRPEIFVVGDLAALRQDGEWIPGMAPAAIQEGQHAAQNVRRALRGEAARPFRYKDRGTLATIGRAAAVARIGRLKLGGFGAWVLWLVVHIAWLIGFRNRLIVLFEWAWAYFTNQRSARVIAEIERKE